MRNYKQIKDQDIRSILDMQCEILDYDVMYADKEIENYYKQRAKKYNVILKHKKYDSWGNNTYSDTLETCKGTVENCLRYLDHYFETEHGYIIGQAFKIIGVKPTSQFKEKLKKFVNWLSSSEKYEEFCDGIKIGEMEKFIS